MTDIRKTDDAEYVSRISDPLEGGADKHDLNRYLQAQGAFSILEVGPGGGHVLANAMAQSKGWHRQDRYVVLDLEQTILDKLAENPLIKDWGRVELVKGDALDMPFPDGEFDIVNLSAVAHECSAYGGGLKGIRKLAAECSRVLKNNGVLLFRDLEGVDLQRKESWELTGHAAKAFFHLFLPRFLDTKHSRVQKPMFYKHSDVTVIVDGTRYGCHEYFAGFDKPSTKAGMSIEAPAGLAKEIMRHFLTFTDAYVPEYFFDCNPSMDREGIILRFDKNSAVHGFREFSLVTGVELFEIGERTFELTREDCALFKEFIERKYAELTKPVLLRCNSEEQTRLHQLLESEGNVHARVTAQGVCVPAWVALSLDNTLRELGVTLENLDRRVVSWSRREGDEHYYYGDLTSVMANFIEESLRVDDLQSGTLSGYSFLVPFESKFVPRRKYSEVLKEQFRRLDCDDDSCSREGKRVIHFRKMPIESGFRKVVEYFYRNPDTLAPERIEQVVHGMQNHIRDHISRSLDFNRRMKRALQAEAFAKNLVEMEDAQDEIENSPEVLQLLGRNIVLVGRIATRKEPFRLFFEQHGYHIYNMTDFLLQDVDSPRPTRRDLYDAGKRGRRKFGDDVLARRVVQAIRARQEGNFLILGCRFPLEVEFLKNEFPELVVVGLYPDTEEIMEQLRQRYPRVSKKKIEKWIQWNDGCEGDGHTNIRMCLQLCDILFNKLGQ